MFRSNYTDYNEYIAAGKKKKITKIAIWVLAVIFALYLIFLGFPGKKISVNNPDWGLANIFSSGQIPRVDLIDRDYILPDKEDNRLDILILGIRGETDEESKENGPLLTDTIQLFSFNEETGKISLVAIPRDLYVKIDGNKKDKLNTVYEYFIYNRNDLKLIREHFSKIIGVYIDNIVVFDFSSFKEIVDSLDGISLVLDRPFEEKNQWGFEFILPAGENHLDGQMALYYVRSRFSSSDFDRAGRQQQVLLAIKERVGQLNIITDPIKILSLANAVKNNIRTDFNIFDTGQIVSLGQKINLLPLKRYTIHTDNLVYESRENGAYILLPNGDDFSQIKRLFQEIIQ